MREVRQRGLCPVSWSHVQRVGAASCSPVHRMNPGPGASYCARGGGVVTAAPLGSNLHAISLFVCRAPVTSASQIRVSVQISAPSLDLERSGDGGSRKQQRLVWTEQNHYEAQLARCTHMHGH
jgi:hypothetical protein